MASWYERSPLARGERNLIRTLIDRAARAQIDWTTEARCRGCGVEQIDPWTALPATSPVAAPAPTENSAAPTREGLSVTRRDFNLIAETIRNLNLDPSGKDYVAHEFAVTLSTTNSRFRS